MNKIYTTDIVRETARKNRYPQSTVSGVLSGVLREIRRALTQGSRVQLTGFGTFYPSRTHAGRGKNFKTGEVIEIPAMTIARFSAGDTLKKAIRRKKK